MINIKYIYGRVRVCARRDDLTMANPQIKIEYRANDFSEQIEGNHHWDGEDAESEEPD